MRSDSGTVSIGAITKKVDVDNRISLKIYYRIANNLIKQADIYRLENNIIDLYVMLLRFSSLLTETLPRHRDYQVSMPTERNLYKKKLLNVLTELEALKPHVQRKIEDLNKNMRSKANSWSQAYQDTPVNNSMEWPALNNRFQAYNSRTKTPGVIRTSFSAAPLVQNDKICQTKLIDRKFSFSMPRPKEETLSRHSVLGPNGLHGGWRQQTVSRGIQYPSSLDLTPVEIPSLEPRTQDGTADVKDDNGTADVKDNNALERERSVLEEVLSLHDDRMSNLVEEPRPAIVSSVINDPPMVDLIREPSPPPVRAEVQDVVAVTSQVTDMSLQDELVHSESPLEVHISTSMMDTFMRMAKSNTDINLETCGVLAGSLKNRVFHVTALIIPKQESTSDSCQTTNEEDIFDYQDKQSLFPLGWIHTHPTQSCFMSSIDVHTHYSYQIMLPEAIAIVMAPRDASRKHGIFRLTMPGGMSVIRNCPQRGFHAHPQTTDGSPIYDHCTDVYMNPNLKFDVVDLR